MKNESNLLKQNWGFYLSRNIPIWHESLTINFSGRSLKKYKLPTLLSMSRIHRGFECDFYHTQDGLGNVSYIKKSLEKNLESKSYLTFLKKNYKKDCDKLLAWSKKLKKDSKSIQKFLEYYGYCTTTLDITAIASKILTDKIISQLKDNPELQEIIIYYTTPKQLAPIQKMEKELRTFNKKINLEKFADKLFKKYYWIPVGFVGEPWPREYFVNLLKVKTSLSKAATKPKTKPNNKILNDLKALADITYLNEYRKGIFSQVCFNIRPLFNQIAQLGNLRDWKDVGLLTHKEIMTIIETKKDMHLIVSERKYKPVIIYTAAKDKFAIEDANTVKQFEAKFKIKTDNTKEIKGTVANRGFYTGIVRVILRHEDFDKFNPGEILVATMTSVDYIPLMKKAGALVTDEGGLACHAAVVSREFNLPCIIGTKIATKILKNGNTVEINANSGIIKIL